MHRKENEKIKWKFKKWNKWNKMKRGYIEINSEP